MDTTRADAIGPEASGVSTPAFNALAAKGRRFRQAYATVPETLPSHISMLTGLYPAGHGVHENARYLSPAQPLVTERLKQVGYRTVAVVSSFVLSKRFGLARGFDQYNDQMDGTAASERNASATTDAALAALSAGTSAQPTFLWVHYNDPHAPYAPPEPYRTQYAAAPYRGEIAAMDAEMGRLVQAFERQATGPTAIIVVADHGEGLGEHGEQQHGHLLYQTTMHVPLVVVGPGVPAGTSDAPVSTRRIFHTLLDWAGLGADHSLRADTADVVLGEAMKPFLEYGWQPQVMAVEGRHKAILAGKVEGFDLAADPGERTDIAAGPALPESIRNALYDYPVPTPGAAPEPTSLGTEDRQKLASLGYVSGGATPVIRKDAPRPADMVALLTDIERVSGLFVNARYADAIPLLVKIRAKDPYNLDATLRLASAYSALGRNAEADATFARAAELAPASADVKVYRALHQARGPAWRDAVPVLEQAIRDTPDREPVVLALATIRERQGQLAMAAADTPAAIAAFEQARALRGARFDYDLELGVLYLAARRLPDARLALDRVPASSPGYAMALFKRAQVSVLLKEPDARARIDKAKAHADATTRALIQSEKMFR
ncbi:MAG: sulfatase-like hydrolase/transferase [Acidobacteria bacterium]|nr:sulfatase-like hydrolase/transferase [Acidobacteriota bacterium]